MTTPQYAGSTPAEQRAEREGLAVVPLATFEALHIAQGHPMIVRQLDGTEVLVRLYTAEEFHAVHLEAARGYDVRPMTLERATELMTPLPELP